MIKKTGFIFIAVMIVMSVSLFAQEAKEIEIDVNALLETASVIFLTGIGGLSVSALVSVIKRILKAQGIAVILISIVVSAAAVAIVLVPVGFILWKFLLLTALVALAANGIYLIPRNRTA